MQRHVYFTSVTLRILFFKSRDSSFHSSYVPGHSGRWRWPVRRLELCSTRSSHRPSPHRGVASGRPRMNVPGPWLPRQVPSCSWDNQFFSAHQSPYLKWDICPLLWLKGLYSCWLIWWKSKWPMQWQVYIVKFCTRATFGKNRRNTRLASQPPPSLFGLHWRI